MSYWNSAHVLSHDLVLLFRGFLSTAWLSSGFTDYKNTFKKQMLARILFMGCRIQHRLSERYLAASRQDSHQNKDHSKAKPIVKPGDMARPNFLDRDNPFALLIPEEPQAGHQALKHLQRIARALYTTLAQTDPVVCKIQKRMGFFFPQNPELGACATCHKARLPQHAPAGRPAGAMQLTG